MSARAPWLLVLLALGPALAQPSESLDALVLELAEQVRAAHPEAPLALRVRAVAPGLEALFARRLADTLERAGLATDVLEAGAPLGPDHRSELQVSLSARSATAEARAQLTSLWLNFWEGARGPSRREGRALFARAPVDGSLGALLADREESCAPGLASFRTRLLAVVPAHTAALASGDLDGDGLDELVALTHDAVLAFSAQGRPRAHHPLKALPWAPAPPREPVGALRVEASGEVAFFSGRHGAGGRLRLEGPGAVRLLGTLARSPLGSSSAPAWAHLEPGRTTFGARVEVFGRALALPGRFVTLSTFASGEERSVLVVDAGGEGRFYQGPPLSAGQVAAGLGAASALADLDGDGRAELVTSSPELLPRPERLRILNLPPGGEPEPLWQGDFEEGRILQVVSARLSSGPEASLVLALWRVDGTTALWAVEREAR